MESKSNNENIDPEKSSKYVQIAREKFDNGEYVESLKHLKKAFALNPSEKINRKIQRIELFVTEKSSPKEVIERGTTKISESGEFHVDQRVWEKLYKHQQEGIKWLWSIHKKPNQVGGILADDMGLGKTIQVVVFLSELFNQDFIKNCLIILPVALINNWTKEFEKWAPTQRVLTYHGTKTAEKRRNLAKIHKRGGVLMTSYGTLVNDWEVIGGEFQWDYVILDEGHKIKNPSTKSAKSVQALNANRRILLTGTAVQNNLDELWALFDFTHQGTLLGTKTTFKMEYANPINNSRAKDATPAEQNYGLRMSHSLRKIISPYFMRRTKAQVKLSEEASKSEESLDGSCKQNVMQMPTMTRKNDLVVWIYLSNIQERIYRDFLQLDDVKQLLTGRVKRSPLMELTILKKICDHPRLLSSNQCSSLGLLTHNDSNDDEEIQDGCAANQIHNIDDDVLIEESGKLVFLVDLVKHFEENQNRVLIFSQSRKILNIISQLLNNNSIAHLRLDGTITKLSDRDQILTRFSTHKRYTAMLLTTQVGGVGLTITAADRVIIYDPSWNPATDAQAVDRVFRIGQQKNVVIYRLITCGTVEEKIYRRQIFKDSITRQTTGVCAKTDSNPYRYFSHQDLRELFSLDDSRNSATQKQLAELHIGQRNTDPTLDDHLAFIHSLTMFGISDHDLMFSQAAAISALDEPATNMVESRRIQAEQRLAVESQENESEKSIRMMMTRMDLNSTGMDTTSVQSRAAAKIAIEQRNPPSELFRPNFNSTTIPSFKKPILPKPTYPSRTLNDFQFTFEKPKLINKTNAAPSFSKAPLKPAEIITVSDCSSGDSSSSDDDDDGSAPLPSRKDYRESCQQGDSSNSDAYANSDNSSALFNPDNSQISVDTFHTPASTSTAIRKSRLIVPTMNRQIQEDKTENEVNFSEDSAQSEPLLTATSDTSEDHLISKYGRSSTLSVGQERKSDIKGDHTSACSNDEDDEEDYDYEGELNGAVSIHHSTREKNDQSDSLLSSVGSGDIEEGHDVSSSSNNEEEEEDEDYGNEKSNEDASFVDLDDIDDCDEDKLVKSILETYNHSLQLEAQSPNPRSKFLALFDLQQASPNKSPAVSKCASSFLLEDSYCESPRSHTTTTRDAPPFTALENLVENTPTRPNRKDGAREEAFDGMVSILPTP